MVDMARGPSGDLYLVEIQRDGQPDPSGRIVHLRYGSNLLPTAVISLVAGSVQEGPPRVVSFTAAGSSDPEGGNLAHAWDLDGDGQYDDSSALAPSYNYSSVGAFLVGLKVTDNAGLSSTTAFPIYTDNGLPDPVIDTPLPGALWTSGQPLSFSGSATDVQDGAIPGSCPGGGSSKLEWTLKISHCSQTNPVDCHQHPEFTNLKTTGGVFSAAHDFPSGLELTLKATDCDGRSVSVVRDIEMNIRFAADNEVGNLLQWSSVSE
jgi:hypothetical protein